MIGNWLSELLGEQTLDAAGNVLVAAYGWAKEWQILLAGVLVLVAAMIVARAIRKAPRPASRSGRTQADLDLRRAASPTSLAPAGLPKSPQANWSANWSSCAA